MNVGGPLPPGISERRYEELLKNAANAPNHPETLAALERAKARRVHVLTGGSWNGPAQREKTPARIEDAAYAPVLRNRVDEARPAAKPWGAVHRGIAVIDRNDGAPKGFDLPFRLKR